MINYEPPAVHRRQLVLINLCVYDTIRIYAIRVFREATIVCAPNTVFIFSKKRFIVAQLPGAQKTLLSSLDEIIVCNICVGKIKKLCLWTAYYDG